MLKNYRLIATVLVFTASIFGAFAQTNETDNYKDVLLNGKPAKLNLITGEVTYSNGEIAKSRAAKKIKDSLLDTRTEIKANLLKDMVATSQSKEIEVVSDSIQPVTEVVNNSTEDVLESIDSISTLDDSVDTSLTTEKPEEQPEEIKDIVASDFHVVKKGETLYELSKRYNLSIGKLLIANDLHTTIIKVGQNLRVRNLESSEKTLVKIWIVSKGDTLYDIAIENNTTVEDIKTLNGLSNSIIKIGQKLQVNQNSTLTKK